MKSSFDIIHMLYNNLFTNLVIDKKLKKDSILISFLDLKSNSRYRVLNDSSENLINENREELSYLINKGLIRNSEEINRYVITAKGIWEVEKDNVSIHDVIGFIDSKYFDISLGSSSIRDKEKVIIMCFIAARAFSLNSAIDLHKDDYTLDSCKRIIDKCYTELNKVGLVKKMSESELYPKSGNEHIVSNLIRHTDSLPKKTKGIFNAAGSQKYYLDVIQNNHIDIEKLSFLVKCVYSENLDIKYEDIRRAYNLCSEIAYQEASYLFDDISCTFTTPEYDDVIFSAFKQAILL